MWWILLPGGFRRKMWCVKHMIVFLEDCSKKNQERTYRIPSLPWDYEKAWSIHYHYFTHSVFTLNNFFRFMYDTDTIMMSTFSLYFSIHHYTLGTCSFKKKKTNIEKYYNWNSIKIIKTNGKYWTNIYLQ